MGSTQCCQVCYSIKNLQQRYNAAPTFQSAPCNKLLPLHFFQPKICPIKLFKIFYSVQAIKQKQVGTQETMQFFRGHYSYVTRIADRGVKRKIFVRIQYQFWHRFSEHIGQQRNPWMAHSATTTAHGRSIRTNKVALINMDGTSTDQWKTAWKC